MARVLLVNKVSITQSDRPGFLLVTDLRTGRSELVEAKSGKASQQRDVIIDTQQDELPGRYHYAP